MISFQQMYEKAQAITGDREAATLIQLKQDINIGYKRFNAATSRYFTRKQQFTDLVAAQQYYQIPVDSIRVSDVSVSIAGGNEYPVEQVRSEKEWRELNISPTSSSYAIFYYVVGNRQIGLWPTPSDSVTLGLRYVYQPQDVDLTKADYNTGTVSVTTNSATVTGTTTVWTAAHIGMYFQTTDGTDGNWYQIIDVPAATTLTLATPYAGTSGSGKTYNMGQMLILPGEYDDVPIDYALYRFAQSRNDPEWRRYQKNFDDAVEEASQRYSTSSTSQVIVGETQFTNPWLWPPVAGP